MENPLYDFLRSLMLPLKEIDKATPDGVVVELGCGEGVISRYLARNKNRKVIGVDLDKSRLQNPKEENLNFRYGDMRSYSLKGVDTAIISDALHHLSYSDQENLLKRISKELKSGAKLIIKEIDTNEFLRSNLSRFWDLVFYPKEKIYFSSSSEMIKRMRNLGFEVRMIRASRLFPGSTTLYICTKE